MNEEKYLEIKKEVINYLKLKNCFCFRRNIIDAFIEDHKKTNVILTLRRMRKEEILKLGLRRWGL